MNRNLEHSLCHVVPGLASVYGGPSYTVPALAAALAARGAPVTLRCVEGADGVQPPGVDLVVHPALANVLGRVLWASPGLKKALTADAQSGAILHVHGLWLMPSVYPAFAKRRSRGKAKIVHAPRGMLAESALRFSAWKKRPFWLLLQRSALEAADCLHATADSEYGDIRAAGLANPVAIIPNGVDVPEQPRVQKRNNENVVLSLGRIHPKQGLDRLIRAWALIENSFPGWRLSIAGPAEGTHAQDLARLAGTLGVRNVDISGAVYGEDKARLFREAGLFVLPTLTENFAVTVAESLAAGTPVISTKGAPWAGLETHRCGWWIDHGPEPMAAALRAAMSLSVEERLAMGARGRTWMARDFAWDAIARQMEEVYRWLAVGSERPNCVRLD